MTSRPNGRTGLPVFHSFRHIDYLIYWTGLAISHVGTWVQSTAQEWLVLELTHSPFKLGLVTTIRFLPVLLFSLVAGVIVDRLSKRRLIIFTQALLLVQAVIMFVLTVTKLIRYEHVIILAVIQGFVQTLDTPARQSFVIEMVGRGDLMNAISLNSAVFNVARMIGPALAGIMIGVTGMPSTFLLNAVSFVAVLAALLFIHPKFAKPPQPWEIPVEDSPAASTRENRPWRSRCAAAMVRRTAKLRAILTVVFKDIGEGLGFIIRTPAVLSVLVLVGAISMFVLNFQVLVPVFAQEVLHQAARGYGFLRSATGIGAAIGAWTLAAISRDEPSRALLFGGAMLLSFLELAMLGTRSFALSMVLLLVMGWAMVTFSAGTQTSIQVNVPDHLRGRVMSVHSLMMGGTTTLGSLFTGWTTDTFGSAAGFGIAGVIGVAVTFAIMAWQKRMQRRAAAALQVSD